MRTDRHDKANSGFSQFCERAGKKGIARRNAGTLPMARTQSRNRILKITLNGILKSGCLLVTIHTDEDEAQTDLFKDPVRTAQ